MCFTSKDHSVSVEQLHQQQKEATSYTTKAVLEDIIQQRQQREQQNAKNNERIDSTVL